MTPFWREKEFWMVVGTIAPGYLAYKGLDPAIVDKVMDYGTNLVLGYLGLQGVNRLAESQKAKTEEKEKTRRERLADRKEELLARMERLEKKAKATSAASENPSPYAPPPQYHGGTSIENLQPLSISGPTLQPPREIKREPREMPVARRVEIPQAQAMEPPTEPIPLAHYWANGIKVEVPGPSDTKELKTNSGTWPQVKETPAPKALEPTQGHFLS